MIDREIIEAAERLAEEMVADFDDNHVDEEVALHAMALVIAQVFSLEPESAPRKIKRLAENLKIAVRLYAELPPDVTH